MTRMITITDISREIHAPFGDTKKWLADLGIKPKYTIQQKRGESKLYAIEDVQPHIDQRKAAVVARRDIREGKVPAPTTVPASIDLAPVTAALDSLSAQIKDLKDQVDAILTAMTTP